MLSILAYLTHALLLLVLVAGIFWLTVGYRLSKLYFILVFVVVFVPIELFWDKIKREIWVAEKRKHRARKPI